MRNLLGTMIDHHIDMTSHSQWEDGLIGTEPRQNCDKSVTDQPKICRFCSSAVPQYFCTVVFGIFIGCGLQILKGIGPVQVRKLDVADLVMLSM